MDALKQSYRIIGGPSLGFLEFAFNNDGEPDAYWDAHPQFDAAPMHGGKVSKDPLDRVYMREFYVEELERLKRNVVRLRGECTISGATLEWGRYELVYHLGSRTGRLDIWPEIEMFY
ncbi:hypothetical protein IIY59_00020 [Candidatus Saccharibacteria bacterium]|nr:hypothetical protein [Candidatus Saccharibacteria bacterium]